MKNKTRFFTRIAKPYFLMLTIVMFIVTILFYFLYVERIKSDAAENSRRLAERTAQLVDGYIDELDMLSEQVKYQPEITNIFYQLNEPGNDINENYFDRDVLNSIDVSSKLKSLLMSRSYSYSIVIYNDKSDVISSQVYQMNKLNDKPAVSESDYEQTVYSIRHNEGRLILPPQQNRWTDGNGMYITIQKELKNNYNDEGCGIIEVRCAVDKLSESLSEGEDEGERIFIRNRSNGGVVFPLNFTESDDKYDRATSDIDKVDWEVVLEYENPMEGMDRTVIIALFVLLYIVLVCFVFIITFSVSRHVTKPLSDLTEIAKTINAADIRPEFASDNAIDEIKELEESFDKMLTRLDKSVQQEKRAYSLALQAQMNPHFLFNTLAVIGSAGAENGCDRVTDMCIELSEMLRYVTEYQKVSVTLREEIEHTKNYLSLMKSRYENYFTYQIDIDDELYDVTFPKLFIEPLVENCFKHGFRNKEAPWRIEIRMHGDINDWVLEIRDNGTGISEAEIIKIKNKVSNAMSEMNVSNLGGLGVVNTIVRLKMTHNKNLKFDFFNDNGMVLRLISNQKG